MMWDRVWKGRIKAWRLPWVLAACPELWALLGCSGLFLLIRPILIER